MKERPYDNQLYAKIKSFIDEYQRPLVFFDDDPDGLCSFLQVKRYIPDATGIVVKSSPTMGAGYIKQLSKDYDCVIILDKPGVVQDFFEAVKLPILWVDHHPVQSPPSKVVYVNPGKEDPLDVRPTSYWIHGALESSIWHAAVGCVGDWFIPPFIDQFHKEYPEFWDEKVTEPDQAYFATKVGDVVRLLSYLLKGQRQHVEKAIRLIESVQGPNDIFVGDTKELRFLRKQYEKNLKEYNELLELGKSKVTEDPLIVFIYQDTATSYTADVSNELLYLYPDKITIVGRIHQGQVKMSLRAKHYDLRDVVQKSLDGVKGYGGGHPNACGACIDEGDFDHFLENIKKQIS